MAQARSYFLAWPAESTTTFAKAYENLHRIIGATCDDWTLHLWHTDAADASFRAAKPAAENSASLADFISTASEATLIDWLQALPISKADLRKLQAAAASAEGTEDAELPQQVVLVTRGSTCARRGLHFLAPAGNSIIPAERGSCRFVHGFMDEDLLRWLSEEPRLFQHEFWQQAAWHRVSEKSWQSEAGLKITVGGDLGEGSSASSVNGIASAGLAFERNAAFVRAFLAINESSFNGLVSALQNALENDPSANAKELCSAKLQSWCLNNLQLHATSTRFASLQPSWRLSPHHESSAGMLLMAYQLKGNRQLHLQSGRSNVTEEIIVQCSPGHVYLANMTAIFHQVTHEFLPHEPDFVLGPLGGCEVAFVVRCTALGHDMVRGSQELSGRSFFKPMQKALCGWLGEHQQNLRLPSLEEVLQEHARLLQPDKFSRKRART